MFERLASAIPQSELQKPEGPHKASFSAQSRAVTKPLPSAAHTMEIVPSQRRLAGIQATQPKVESQALSHRISIVRVIPSEPQTKCVSPSHPALSAMHSDVASGTRGTSGVGPPSRDTRPSSPHPKETSPSQRASGKAASSRERYIFNFSPVVIQIQSTDLLDPPNSVEGRQAHHSLVRDLRYREGDRLDVGVVEEHRQENWVSEGENVRRLEHSRVKGEGGLVDETRRYDGVRTDLARLLPAERLDVGKVGNVLIQPKAVGLRELSALRAGEPSGELHKIVTRSSGAPRIRGNQTGGDLGQRPIARVEDIGCDADLVLR